MNSECIKHIQQNNDIQNIFENIETTVQEVTEVYNPLGEDAGAPGICKVKGKVIGKVVGRAAGKMVGRLIGGIPGYIAWGVGETIIRHYALGQSWKDAAKEGFSPI